MAMDGDGDGGVSFAPLMLSLRREEVGGVCASAAVVMLKEENK
jgi:hypothetical protein